MPPYNNKQHMTDLLFVLALLGVFALSAMFLITLGSTTYQRITDSSEQNYSERASYSYIVEKVRQKQGYNCVSIVQDFGDSDAIVLKETIQGLCYETWLYQDEGYLKELFCKEGSNLSPKAGQSILQCQDFQISFVAENLLHVYYVTEQNTPLSFYICNKGGQ